MKSLFFISIYLILLIVNVFGNLFAMSVLSNGTKIFLMPALFVVWAINMNNKRLKLFKWTSIALFFSWLGDILLIFQGKDPMYFLFGLGAFLIAHLSYIIDYRIARLIKPSLALRYWVLPGVFLIIFLSFLFIGIGPGLNDYAIPVVLYGLAISGMFLMAYSRSGRTTKQSFILVLLGASVFVLSDSLIAINKFWMEVPKAGAWIMLTYGTAQFIIIMGLIDHGKSVQ
jgi:uncharacterized membrane protein YhhN